MVSAPMVVAEGNGESQLDDYLLDDPQGAARALIRPEIGGKNGGNFELLQFTSAASAVYGCVRIPLGYWIARIPARHSLALT